MKFSICQVTLNKITYIPYRSIRGLRIKSSIEDGLPFGFIEINDSDGLLLAQFNNLQVGALVDVVLLNPETGEKGLKFPPFYILQLEGDNSITPNIFAGNFKIWFGHPWFLYKDIKNHAYKPGNNAEIIKKILRSEDRGIAFEVDNKNFDVTDDASSRRFKVGETDWDFIQNKIIPFTTSDLQPVHFFCSDAGDFYLKSFKNMYSKNPKALILPADGSITEAASVEEANTICKNFNIKPNAIFSVIKADYTIGGHDLTQNFYPSFAFEDVRNNTQITGRKTIKNMLQKRSGGSFGNILPVDKYFMLKVAGTSTNVLRNRQLDDSLYFIYNLGKKLDTFFKLEVFTKFAGDVLSIGDCAEIFLEKVLIQGVWKKHWMSGKWLVYELDHFTDPEKKSNQLWTRMILIRPTFVGNDGTTTLGLKELMFETV